MNPKEPSLVLLRITEVAGHQRECDPVVSTLVAELPSSFHLEQNYPNPFNPTTRIRFQVAEQARVHLEVYDVLGRRVAMLLDEPMQPGTYEAEWDGRSEAGAAMAGGVYVYRLQAGSFTESRTMTLLK